MRRRLPPPLALAGRWSGGIVLIWVVIFWRLGMPSFWDPGDEAHYAQATREMLSSDDWLVPRYNGQPFFDKPIFFYLLQMIAFRLLGPTELAARLVPAFSALALFGATWWLGARLFGRRVGLLGVIMLALLPATFALSSYAILDMTFTALLFSGLAAIAVSALRDRPRLQYGGYVLLGLAVLTKGPLALALAGLAFFIALLIAPAARRSLWRLRWGVGLAIILTIALPWFVYMWSRFGDAFIDGYLLRENIWLFTRGVGGAPGRQLSYARVITIGSLPWTPLLVGRLIDIARGHGCSTEERLLWAWATGVTGFFALSQFKLDHYVYPAAPALCLLAAQAWSGLREDASSRAHLGAAAGAAFSSVAIAGAGFLLLTLRTPLPPDTRTPINVAAILLLAAGVLELGRLIAGRFRPPPFPLRTAVGMLAAYSVLLIFLLPKFEEAKPVKPLALWVATRPDAPDHIGAYRMDRWNTSWRFYVDRSVTELDTLLQLETFFRRPGRKFCLILQRDIDALIAAGYRVQVERTAPGLFVTSGRVISRGRASNWQLFVIVSNISPPPAESI